MSIESWIALVVALTILGLSPGPAWAAVVATAMGRGFAAAFAMALGVALGDVFFLLLAVFGLAALAEALGTLFFAVKLLGAAYLIGLGLWLWRHPPRLQSQAAVPKKRGLGPFLGGFALTLGNPKVIAFYLGFLPAFLDLTSLTMLDVTAVAVTAFVVIAGLLAAYAALAARSRALLSREKPRRVLGRLLGATLIGSGVAVATR